MLASDQSLTTSADDDEDFTILSHEETSDASQTIPNSSRLGPTTDAINSHPSSLYSIHLPLPNFSNLKGKFSHGRRIRSKSVGNNPDLQRKAMAELKQHVHEVKRYDDAPPPPEVLDASDWITFFKAWKSHLVNRAIKESAPFELNRLRSNSERLYTATAPLQARFPAIASFFLWHRPLVTGFWFSVYWILWWHDIILTCISLSFLIVLVAYNLPWGTANRFSIGVGVVPETPPFTGPDERRRIRKKVQESTERTEKMSPLDWWDEWRNAWGPLLQFTTGELADYVERSKNLYLNRSPRATRCFAFILLTCTIFFHFLPARYQPKVFWAIVGLMVFVLIPLQAKHPRYRRLFNPFEWVVWGVPTDAEWAMQTYLYEGPTIIPPPVNSAKEGTKLAKEGSIDGRASTSSSAGKDTTNGISPRSSIDEGAPILITDADGCPIPVKNHDSLSFPAREHPAGAEEEEEEEGGEEEEEEEDDNSGDLNNTSSDVLAKFRCIYKSIPGRLLITPTTLRFRTSRALGGKMEVELPLDEIVGVKKAKSVNLLFTHTKRIEITIKSGEVYFFDSVLKRDDAFNKIVSVSGRSWRSV